PHGEFPSLSADADRFRSLLRKRCQDPFLALPRRQGQGPCCKGQKWVLTPFSSCRLERQESKTRCIPRWVDVRPSVKALRLKLRCLTRQPTCPGRLPRPQSQRRQEGPLIHSRASAVQPR